MREALISVTIVRLFAIGAVVFAMQNAATVVYLTAGDDGFDMPAWADFYVIVAAIAIPSIAAVNFWTRPSIVIGSTAVVGARREERTLDAPGLLNVGLGLIGAYFMAFALASILEWLVFHLARKQELPEFSSLPAGHCSPLFSKVVWLLIRLSSFLGASGIRNAFFAVRNLGLTPIDRPGETQKDRVKKGPDGKA